MATAFTLDARGAGIDRVLAARALLWAEVVVFLGVTTALSIVLSLAQRALGLDLADLDSAPEAALALIPILAGAPGIGALMTRLVFQRSLRGAATDWGLRTIRGIGRPLLVSALLPCLYVSLAYLGVYALGLGGFNGDALGTDAAVALVGGGLAMGVLALFEEIGWRGFLVPSLARLVSGRGVLLLSGLAWAAFHYPLLLLVPGGNHGLPDWYAVTLFTLVIMASNVPYVWLRMRSGSLWPAVVLHTIHNTLIYSLFEPLTVSSDLTAYAQGEQGFTLLVTLAVVAAIFWRPAVRAVQEHGRS